MGYEARNGRRGRKVDAIFRPQRARCQAFIDPRDGNTVRSTVPQVREHAGRNSRRLTARPWIQAPEVEA